MNSSASPTRPKWRFRIFQFSIRTMLHRDGGGRGVLQLVFPAAAEG